MNAPYNAPTAASEPASSQILAARKTCRELLVLLMEENNGLARHDVKVIDERLSHKKRLTLRLESMLAELKQNGSLWKADASARQQSVLLAEEIAEFQNLARENTLLLKAAHQLRADLLLAIRDTVDAHQPRVQTYGSGGTMNAASSETRLVTTSI